MSGKKANKSSSLTGKGDSAKKISKDAKLVRVGFELPQHFDDAALLLIAGPIMKAFSVLPDDLVAVCAGKFNFPVYVGSAWPSKKTKEHDIVLPVSSFIPQFPPALASQLYSLPSSEGGDISLLDVSVCRLEDVKVCRLVLAEKVVYRVLYEEGEMDRELSPYHPRFSSIVRILPYFCRGIVVPFDGVRVHVSDLTLELSIKYSEDRSTLQYLGGSTIFSLDSSSNLESEEVLASSRSFHAAVGLDREMAQLKRLCEPRLFNRSTNAISETSPATLTTISPATPAPSSTAIVTPFIELGLPAVGALLAGPPGTGKTLLARTLARSVGCPLLPFSVAPQAQISAVGDTAARVRSFFASARARPPCLVLLDETDALMEDERLLAALCVEMDRIAAEHVPLFVLGATNAPDSVPAAFRRPARFDVEIEVPPPNSAARFLILCSLLGLSAAEGECRDGEVGETRNSGNPAHSISLKEAREISEELHGFVGADIAELVRAAGARALAQSRLAISVSDLRFARAHVRPSSLRAAVVEAPRVSWADVAGQEETKARLREAVEWPLAHARAFRRLGVRAPRGLLLFGPPGCSKTLLARAMASQGRMNFLAVRGPELLSKYVGDSEKAVAEVFRRARAAAPAVLFFDEFDALAAARTDDANGVAARVVAQLLLEMDSIQRGAQNEHTVVVVAATNRPDVIDPAILRPGRMDRLLFVGLPDAPARAQIIGTQWRKINQAGTRAPLGDEDLLELAALTEGFSGAEVVGIMREAAVACIRQYSIAAFERLHVDGPSEEEPMEPPSITKDHVVSAIKSYPKQVTKEMLDFYKQFTRV